MPISSLTLRHANGAVTELIPKPAPPPPPSPPPAPANLYDVKIRTLEWLEQPAPPSVASFAIVGGRGITMWLEIGPREVEFIRSIVIPEKHVNNDLLWKWASGAGERMGITVYYGNDPARGTWRWGIGLMSSFPGAPRQYAKIEHYDPARAYQFVSGIPYRSDGDYSAWTPERAPWAWFLCHSVYPADDENPNGHLLQESHNGLVFLMPYFQAGTGFRQSAWEGEDDGPGWIKTSCFLGPHT